jgi:hypothetical protein
MDLHEWPQWVYNLIDNIRLLILYIFDPHLVKSENGGYCPRPTSWFHLVSSKHMLSVEERCEILGVQRFWTNGNPSVPIRLVEISAIKKRLQNSREFEWKSKDLTWEDCRKDSKCRAWGDVSLHRQVKYQWVYSGRGAMVSSNSWPALRCRCMIR